MKYKYIIAIICDNIQQFRLFLHIQNLGLSSFATIELQEDSNRWSPDDALKKHLQVEV